MNYLPDIAVIQMTTDNRILLTTTDPNKARQYNLQVIGVISGGRSSSNKATQNFTITVTNKCPTATVIPTPITDKIYYIGSTPIKFSFDPWQDSLGDQLCGLIIYSLTLSDNTPVNPDLIKFDNLLREVTVFTRDTSFAADMILKVNGKLSLSGKIESSFFKLLIIDPCSMTTIYPEKINDQSYDIGQGEMTFSFTEWKESLGNCGPFNYSISILPQFQTSPVQFNSLARTFTVSIESGFEEDTQLSINVQGQLKSGPIGISSFKLNIKPQILTGNSSKTVNFTLAQERKKKIERMEPSLTARIISIDTNGVATMKFTKYILAIDDLSMYQARRAMSFIVEPKNSEQRAYAIIDWNVTTINKDRMTVQLLFPEPEKVSITTNYDVLRVKFNNPTFFFSQDEKSILKKDLILYAKIPPQQKQTPSTKALQSVQQSVSSVLVGSLASNFVLCVICGVSMSNVWQLMNNIQIITMIPLLKIPVPPQFISFCQMMLDFASLNILPEEASMKNIKQSIVGDTTIDSTIISKRMLQTSAFNSSNTDQMDLNFAMMDIFQNTFLLIQLHALPQFVHYVLNLLV